MACQPILGFSSSSLKYEHAYFYKYVWCVARWRCPHPGFGAQAAAAAIAGTTRFPVLPPLAWQQNLHNRTDALQLTLCHSPLRLFTDNRPALQQAAGEPKGFGGWCVNAARSLRLSSPPVSQRVSVQGGRTTTSRPGGEISARHAARPRKLICPCDTLALPSHWSADHVTGCDWWRVTSDQLHQIWPGCSWGQQQQQHYALHFYSTQNPLKVQVQAPMDLVGT